VVQQASSQHYGPRSTQPTSRPRYEPYRPARKPAYPTRTSYPNRLNETIYVPDSPTPDDTYDPSAPSMAPDDTYDPGAPAMAPAGFPSLTDLQALVALTSAVAAPTKPTHAPFMGMPAETDL
jgi:hypothetical protein